MTKHFILAAGSSETFWQAWAWPITILILVLAFLAWVTYSTAAQPFLKIVFGRVRRVTAFGVEFDLSEKAALQTRTNVEAGFKELRQKLTREFDSQVDAELLDNKLLYIAKNVIEPMLATDEAKRTYRCSVHVPDVLFEDALYQLLDYQPTGGGRGRTRSVRFGIIGTCWRLGHSDVQPDVTTNAAELVKAWAMTTSEAAVVGRDRRSFIAVPLVNTDHQPVGVFYVDAVPQNAWKNAPVPGQEHPICQQIADQAKEIGLVAALSRIMKVMRRTGPRVRLIG